MVSLVCHQIERTSYAECASLRTRASIQKREEATASLASLLATPMEYYYTGLQHHDTTKYTDTGKRKHSIVPSKIERECRQADIQHTYLR